MIYPSSVLCTPIEVIKEFNSLVFRFLWNGNDKVIRLSTYAPYDQGGLKMLDYDNMVKALRLSWLKRLLWFLEVISRSSFGQRRGVISNSVQLRYQPINNPSDFLSRTIGLVVKIKRSQGPRKYIYI